MQSRAQDAGKGGLVPPIIAGTGAKTNTTDDICMCTSLERNLQHCNILFSVFAIANIFKRALNNLGINVCIEVG